MKFNPLNITGTSTDQLIEFLINNYERVNYKTVGLDSQFALVYPKLDRLDIYIKCTSSTIDWVKNLSALAVPYNDMKLEWQCHYGFLSVWQDIKDYIISAIKNPLLKEINVIGYSQGGAVSHFAHECVWYYRKDLRPKEQGGNGGLKTYAFASPRVICKKSLENIEFKKRFENLYIIANYGDIVPFLPTKFMCYSHVNKVIWFGKKIANPILSHNVCNYVYNMDIVSGGNGCKCNTLKSCKNNENCKNCY